MLHILWFQQLQLGDLLLFFVIYHKNWIPFVFGLWGRHRTPLETPSNLCFTLGDYEIYKTNLYYLDQYHYQSTFNYTQLARIKSSHLIHLWPWRQKRGRTRLLARAHRLVRLHGTRCYTAAQCQPHLCPRRHRTLQGMPGSPGCSASHTCPSSHRLTLI